MSSSFSRVCSILKQSGDLMSSRLMPPKVGAMKRTAWMTSSGVFASMQTGKASTPPKRLNSTDLPSMTGSDAVAPMLPRPKTAVPFETTAMVFALQV